ncbi:MULTISPECIES: hypothetical protein [Bacillus]|nr:MULTISPECIES: hypothetical protein [Bacillus]
MKFYHQYKEYNDVLLRKRLRVTCNRNEEAAIRKTFQKRGTH